MNNETTNNEQNMNHEMEDTNFEVLDAIRKQYAANGVNVLEARDLAPGTEDTTSSTRQDEEDVPTATCHNQNPEEERLVTDEKAVEKDNKKEGLSNSAAVNTGGQVLPGTGVPVEESAVGKSGVQVLPGTGVPVSEAQPGAYAEALDGHQPVAFSSESDTSGPYNSQLLPEYSSNDGVPVADAVNDEEQGRLNLPQAESMDGYSPPNNNPKTGSDRSLKTMAIICSALVVVAIVVLVAVLVPKRQSNQGATLNQGFLPPNTLSPLASLESKVLALFPEYTLEALQDPASSQSMAMSWLLEDPNLETYLESNWRVRQRFALVTFYFANSGDRWDLNDRWLSYEYHECSWWARPWFAPPSPGFFFIGVEYPNPCECENVTAPNNDEDAEYKHLWVLKNNLQGSIPEEIYWMTSLRSLSLSLNPLGGTISTRLGLLSNLEAATLSRNERGLSGTIPTEIENLSKLEVLSLMGNRLRGDVSILGKLSRLRIVMADKNEFAGHIPSELGQLTNLELLYLDVNSFTGTLPTELGRLDLMWDFFVSDNDLSGTIPSEFGLLKSLERVSFRNNALGGTLCTELGTLSLLHSIEFQNNEFTGPIPSELGAVPTLIQLFAQNNELIGTIPAEIRNRVPISNSSTTGSLLTLNVTHNPLSERLSPNEACWVNTTFFEGDGCNHYDYLHLGSDCSCQCACPLHDEASLNGSATT